MKLMRTFLLILLFANLPSGSISQEESETLRDSFEQDPHDSETHTGNLSFFKSFDVSFLDNPALNYQTALICTVIQRDFASDIFIEVLLPEGFELVDGTLTWQGHASPGQALVHQVTIKAVKPGKWVIRVWGGPPENPRFDLQNVYAKVTETSAEVFADPYFGQTEFTEEEIRALAQCKSTSDIDDRARTVYEEEPESEPEAQWIWVTGTVKAVYGSDEIRIPYAKVELYDDDSGLERHLATSCTDSSGYFSFYVENNDGPSQGGLDIFVKVHCTYWRNGETDKCVYVCPNLLGIAYSARNPAAGCIPNVGGDVHFGSISIIDSGPWYIYHYSLEEYEFFKNVGWWQQKIKVWWPANKNEFVGGTGLYHITIKSGYENDIDIIQHEYAHAVMWKVYGDDFPDTNFLGVNHWFNTKTDGGFALIEGWAEFVPNVINKKRIYSAYDFEPHFQWSNTWDGEIVEGCIASILLDIADDNSYTGGSDDEELSGFYFMWNIIKNYNPNSINEFWYYWFDVYHYGFSHDMWWIYYHQWIKKMGFSDIPSMFPHRNFHVVGDQAKCTDVLGTANASWVYGHKWIERPEGKTDLLLTPQEHDTGNLIIVGGPAVNPLATEIDNHFGISYVYQPGINFTILWENQSISLDLWKYPSEDICIVYLGNQNERSTLVIWGYGWQGTYAGSLFMSIPQVWNAYHKEHLLLLRWRDTNGNGFCEFTEIHPENIPEISVTPPSPGTPQLVNPVFGNIGALFAGFTFHIVGDTAKCTDVLGTANISWAFGRTEIARPEGKTDVLLTPYEHDNGNVIIVGGPAVNPLATEFDNYFGVTYTYVPGVYFTIFCQNENKSISLDLNNYPSQDICIVYIGRQNNRNTLIIWGYGWEGTYAGSLFMSNPYNWTAYATKHVLLLRWFDVNHDGYIQTNEVVVEVDC